MKTDLIILDIDGVLLPWDFANRGGSNEAYDPKGLATGFTDWEVVNERYFSFISQDQLGLIQKAGDIVWLTTWLTQPGMIEKFEDVTGFGPHPRVPNQPISRLFSWWKAHNLVRYLEDYAEEFAERYERIVWVDDDIPIMRTHERDEVIRVSPLPIKFVPTNPVWRRHEIEELIQSEDS